MKKDKKYILKQCVVCLEFVDILRLEEDKESGELLCKNCFRERRRKG